MVERLALLFVIGLILIAVVWCSRWWARRRLGTLQRASAETLWRALEVVPDGRPVVVAFSSPSCAACRTTQYPVLRALEQKSTPAPRIIAVDVSKKPAAADAFGVLTVPSTVVMSSVGRVMAANHGFAPVDLLAEQVRLAAAGSASASR